MDIFQRCYDGYKNWTVPVSKDDKLSPTTHNNTTTDTTTDSTKQKTNIDNMITILHDEATLLHSTVELLGSKLRPALESPDRVRAIVSTLKSSNRYNLRTISANSQDQNLLLDLAKQTHDPGYLHHIETVFQSWLDEGLVEPHESVLPECFRLHNNAVATLKPPKDIYARAGYYAFDMSTGVMRESWTSIVASANLAIEAARLLVAGEREEGKDGGHADHQPSSTRSMALNKDGTRKSKTVVALCRPPGHHCTGEQAGGYCYINNIALTVSALRHFSSQSEPPSQSQPQSRSVSSHNKNNLQFSPTKPHPPILSTLKFALLDLDFHHGNGTQSLFYNDPSTLYVSLHGRDEFPYYTGSASETGPPSPHPAANTTYNFPLPVNTPITVYLETLQKAMNIIKEWGPDYLLLSLGFDTFHLDPLGKFEIDTGDYTRIAACVRHGLRGVKSGRARGEEIDAVILLEGGYVIERLGENFVAFLEGWEGDAGVDVHEGV